ncbi:uncharacterized protein J7T54_003681 [Emericellopsis cladophorae]|uniref:GPI transamidase component PIG-S n=1 Tax=Emericellopsis cladophorae TaxID=2686198 RepID=A0A9P9Y307_9HYPO|nr:uncharacterized protein J7T54_003681 [Emericellopsis cladophorae]KAI6782668.1 hypothetical protein J7T54_003681 [Emericellopsis cladophorae]
MSAAPSEKLPDGSVKKAIKLPPNEKGSDVRRRSFIVLSFWAVVVMLGLPFWWYTTSIYRANLPLDRMLEWADGKACQHMLPVTVAFEAEGLAASDAQELARLTQGMLDQQSDLVAHQIRLQLGHTENAALALQFTPGTQMGATLDSREASLKINYPSGTTMSNPSDAAALATYLAQELRAAFAEERAIISHLLNQPLQNQSPETIEALSKRTTRSMRYASTYHLTFSLFTDGPSPSTWDIEEAVDQYMRPMLDILRPIHNFTVDTQLQLYATPGVQSQVLSKEDLSSFINAAEWPLSPSIGGAPTVNFVLFVGNQTIGNAGSDATSQSWMIPQWGTVYLLPLSDSTAHVDSEILRQPMLTFGGHLLTLLGTPQSGSLPLRLSTLTRIRSLDLLLRASSTLGSLARLSVSLPSISIPRTVADGVAASLEHLEKACANLGGPEGLYHARIAGSEAEKAFFEKSMVGQLYFPDEHKIAVYLPLLGPVGVPLVLGLIKELKGWKQRRKDAKETKDIKKQ